MEAHVRRLVDALARDLGEVFGERLSALVMFGAHVPDGRDHETPGEGEPVRTLALVERLAFTDLEMCAERQRRWARAGLATPLLLAQDDFVRSLDAFPLEFATIIHRHVVIVGGDPFTETVVRPDDLRRACEVQARSHVLHLREGYLEAAGDPAAIERLVAASAPALQALLVDLALLDGTGGTSAPELARHAGHIAGVPATVFSAVLGILSSRVPTADGARLFPTYLAAMEQLAAAIDRQGHP